MKLLILTQAVDKKDPVLGFFHRWLEEFAKRYERVTVICLKKGVFDLPANVSVLSLGKEEGENNFQFSIFNFQKIQYLWRFYRYIWRERTNYDAVFVHMNQEYVLLGWPLWLALRKRVHLWRNHAKGTFLTRLAVLLSRKVFYTSPQSYTARFAKAVQMPVGIDTDFFAPPEGGVTREPGTILFLGRIAPVKRVREFVDWLTTQDFNYATIAGAALPQDRGYEREVKARIAERGLTGKVIWAGAVDQPGARRLYQSHETYANFTPPGSFDKTIFEAAACGTRLVLDNPDLNDLQQMSGEGARAYVIKNHSLRLLADRMASELS
jgi:glycosyltransferase involved in cell wall biosynthesis